MDSFYGVVQLRKGGGFAIVQEMRCVFMKVASENPAVEKVDRRKSRFRESLGYRRERDLRLMGVGMTKEQRDNLARAAKMESD